MEQITLMKSLEISEEQKEHLLEMCKALFPEYKGDISFNLEDESDKTSDYNGFLIGFLDEFADYKPNCDLYIHWFEFCTKELLSKISFTCRSEMLGEEEFIQNYNKGLFAIFLEQQHPIDYLYSQFKKLK